MQVFNRASMLEHIVSLNGEYVTITIEKRDKRSNKMNRLMWAYHRILGDYLGYTHDEIHQIFKMKFLKREIVNEKTGEVLEYLKSTTELSNKELGDILDQYRIWAADTFDCYLPEANEQTNLKL